MTFMTLLPTSKLFHLRQVKNILFPFFVLIQNFLYLQRYNLKNEKKGKSDDVPISYTYLLSTPTHPAPMSNKVITLADTLTHTLNALSQVQMQHTTVNYSWNYLDELICGYTDDLFDTLKYNCLKMVLAPVSTVSEEKTAVAAFARFKEWLVSKKPYQSEIGRAHV